MLIGDADNAVVFDFQPGLDAGAELLGRRGEDQRFDARPARLPSAAARSTRRCRPAREEETRADVARRLGHPDLADEEPDDRPSSATSDP